ncbi:MAG: hypothetical protein K9K39_06950 [Desulfohalobiaceae bacterium]|nr:hypothetical protein [Desulfohalobiaceae bacterium]
MRPLAQGELDGLCGVYAVLNSIRYLYNLDQQELEYIFLNILRNIEQKHQLSRFIYEGLSGLNISQILNYDFIQDKFPVKEKPFHKQKKETLPEFWELLKNTLDNYGGIFIVSISKWDYKNDRLSMSHWSTVFKVKEKRMYFYDSYALKWLDRSKLMTKEDYNDSSRPYFISPSYTYYLNKE